MSMQIAAHYTYPGGSIYTGTKHFIDACKLRPLVP